MSNTTLRVGSVEANSTTVAGGKELSWVTVHSVDGGTVNIFFDGLDAAQPVADAIIKASGND